MSATRSLILRNWIAKKLSGKLLCLCFLIIAHSRQEKSTLIDKGVLLSKDEKASDYFNTDFVNVTDALKIKRALCMRIDDPIENLVHAAILLYSKQLGIIQIKGIANDTNISAFHASKCFEVWDEINHLSIRNTQMGMFMPTY